MLIIIFEIISKIAFRSWYWNAWYTILFIFVSNWKWILILNYMIYKFWGCHVESHKVLYLILLFVKASPYFLARFRLNWFRLCLLDDFLIVTIVVLGASLLKRVHLNLVLELVMKMLPFIQFFCLKLFLIKKILYRWLFCQSFFT